MVPTSGVWYMYMILVVGAGHTSCVMNDTSKPPPRSCDIILKPIAEYGDQEESWRFCNIEKKSISLEYGGMLMTCLRFSEEL